MGTGPETFPLDLKWSRLKTGRPNMQHSATSLYLPVAIVDALRQRAKAADRSTSKEATRLLRQALAVEDREGGSG